MTLTVLTSVSVSLQVRVNHTLDLVTQKAYAVNKFNIYNLHNTKRELKKALFYFISFI
jgi:hypothetical protein